MPDVAGRTLAILSLLQAQREWSGDALAARLGVTSRTIRRDFTRLRELGYPVEAARGPGGLYRLAPGTRLPPLVFDDEQAISIVLALQTAPSSVVGLDDAAARALRTLKDLMPPPLARRLQTFEVHQIDNAWDLAPPKVPSGMLTCLSTAAQQLQVVSFSYRACSGDAAEDVAAVVEPYKLVVWSGRWYFIGYDQRERSWLSYRLDRVENLHVPGWRFTPRQFPADDVTAFIQLQPDRGDDSDAWPCRGTVRMDCPVELVAKWAPGGANLAAIDESTTRITMGAWSWAGLLGLLCTFSCDFVIEGPPELTAAAGEMSRRLARSAKTGPVRS